MRSTNAPKVYQNSMMKATAVTPETIHRQESLNDKKVRARFNYTPQMSDKHLDGPEGEGKVKHKGTGGISITNVPKGA